MPVNKYFSTLFLSKEDVNQQVEEFNKIAPKRSTKKSIKQ